MGVIIEVKNVKEFETFMKKKQELTKEKIAESVRQATLHVHNAVKESIARGTNAPVTVDTGRFLNSVDFEATGDNEAKVFTELEYAKFLEYGTSKMAARPHFGNTAKVEFNNVKEKMNAEIKKITE
jgi:HK97 gp10 family phage protein